MKRRAACISVLALFFLVGKGVPASQASGGGKEAQQVSSVVTDLRAPARPDTPCAQPDLPASAETLGSERLLAANVGFNAQVLGIVFKVQTAVYKLSTVGGRITVAQAGLESAAKVQEAAEERFQHGLASAPDVSLARQQAAQAAFDLEEVNAKERDAQVALAENIGILPTTPLRVADFSRLSLPTNLEQTVEKFIDRTLEQRPDLLARVAVLR